MLGWNLLQIHNHAILTSFFEGVRAALNESAEKFDELHKKFLTVYEPEVPAGTGVRPRARGYHFKSIAGQTKINEPSWQAFDSVDASPHPEAIAEPLAAVDGTLPVDEVAPSLEK
jgi:queuine tRNA-ribosyltransferase